MFFKTGFYTIQNDRVKTEKHTLILRERKQGFTEKKPKNYSYVNSFKNYCSSIYPVNKIENWQIKTLAELNGAGIFDFWFEYQGVVYFIYIDISKNLFQIKELEEAKRA